MTVSREAILKVATTIKARDKVDDAEALRRAEAWAAKKDAPPPPACKLTADEQRAGKFSLLCPCPGCGNARQHINDRSRRAERAWNGSAGNW